MKILLALQRGVCTLRISYPLLNFYRQVSTDLLLLLISVLSSEPLYYHIFMGTGIKRDGHRLQVYIRRHCEITLTFIGLLYMYFFFKMNPVCFS